MKITSYDTLPLGKYQQIITMLKNEKDDIDAHAAILAIMYDKKEEDIMNLPLQEYMNLSESISFLLQPLPQFKPRAKDKYVIGDLVLIPTKNIKKFTAAQYIDYQMLIKENDKLVELVSTLLVPKGCTYGNGYDIAEVYDAVEKMSVAEVAELSAFFLQQFRKLIDHSLTYLGMELMMTTKRKERKEMMKTIRTLRNLVKSGVGFIK
jgi:hypothetical protein